MSPLPFLRASSLRRALGWQILATLLCGGLWLARYLWSGSLRFSGFFGNLLLAWIPLLLTLALLRWKENARVRWPLGVLWFLFFPNAFYLVTDLIHVNKFGTDGLPRWFDQMLTSTYALCGVFLACLSLYLLQQALARCRGARVGWVFAVSMLALSALGIYLGRIFRLNSWDPFVRWDKLARTAVALTEPGRLGELCAFTAVEFAFSLVAYCLVISMVELRVEESEVPR